MQSKLTAFIRRKRLFSPQETVVIGVSGGADSLALAHILANLAPQLQIQIHIATFNHGIRPEANTETDFVVAMAQAWDVPCTVGQGDVLTLRQTEKLGLEEAARKARYLFFADVARRIGATTVVTAHHQDDQAETFLLHLIRGAGSKGAQAMRLVQKLPYMPSLRLVRPLLHIPRQDLVAYCHAQGLTPIQDPSNDNIDLTRNRIRHEVMPILRAINPKVTQALVRFADIYADEQEILDAVFSATVLDDIESEDGRFYIPRDEFRILHNAFQRRLFLDLLPIPNMTYQHITHAVRVAQTGQVGAIAQFPEGWQLRVDYENLVLEQVTSMPTIPAKIPLMLDTTHVVLKLEQIQEIDGRWRIHITTNADAYPFAPHTQLTLPQNARLLLRTRQPSDRFAPIGLKGKHQSLKNWMINHKMPHALRTTIPLLVVNDEIALILWGDTFHVSHQFMPMPDNHASYNIFVYFLNK